MSIMLQYLVSHKLDRVIINLHVQMIMQHQDCKLIVTYFCLLSIALNGTCIEYLLLMNFALEIL